VSFEERQVPLELPDFPEFPAAAAGASPSAVSGAEVSTVDLAGKTSLDSGDDSLTEWVGHALSSFTGDTLPAESESSSAGVSDPALFGRDASILPDPGALDLLPPTNAMRDRPSRLVRHALPGPPEPDSLPSEAHSRGIPTSIPPFRRATDPSGFEPAGPASFSDDVAAGMWKPGPDETESAGASEPASLSSVSSGIAPDSGSGARRREEIADSLLEGPLEALPRVLLLAFGKNGVTGWRGRGAGLEDETVAAIRIPGSEISIFSSVQQSGVPHFGAIDRAEWPPALASLFGVVPPDCAIFPIRVLDGVAAFLYVDRLGAPMQYEDFAIVARAAATAANVLSRFLLRNDRSRSPVRS
jgi:hypothetical protein